MPLALSTADSLIRPAASGAVSTRKFLTHCLGLASRTSARTSFTPLAGAGPACWTPSGTGSSAGSAGPSSAADAEPAPGSVTWTVPPSSSSGSAAPSEEAVADRLRCRAGIVTTSPSQD